MALSPTFLSFRRKPLRRVYQEDDTVPVPLKPEVVTESPPSVPPTLTEAVVYKEPQWELVWANFIDTVARRAGVPPDQLQGLFGSVDFYKSIFLQSVGANKRQQTKTK